MTIIKPTQCDRIIAKLKADMQITSVWAMKHYIFRLSERIRELEAVGWKFAKGFVRKNGKKTRVYQYALLGVPKKRV